MNIVKYSELMQELIEYNDNNADINHGNVIVPYATQNPTYPYTVVDEIDNKPYNRYERGRDALSATMYRVDIFAKTIGDVTKQTICREIADQIDVFMDKQMNLKQTSFNVMPLQNDSAIYQITMVYSGTIFNYRNKFI